MARIANFFDGAESETTPTIGNIVASALVQYADDAAYEANEQGAPARGNIYYNTTDDTIRYYNGTIWQEVIDESTTQAVENKAIDADNNQITNIDNNEIKPLAGIEATKIHDGSVDNTEFGHLDGVTSNIQTQLNAKQETSEKGQPNGYASLDGSGLVPSSQLPSYVDDVLEFADLASFPVTGETGKIYLAQDTNLIYRWTGSVYVQITSGVDDLSDLVDVNTSGVADRDQLIYNSGAGEWQPSRADLGELGDVDLTTTPPVAGNALVYDGADWVPGEGGGSGVGGISYVQNPDAETDASGYNTYDDGLVADPVDGDGGSPGGLVVERTTDAAEVLRGTASIRINKSAVNAQGEGVHVNLDPIHRYDKQKRLQVSFDYKHPAPLSNNYASGDLAVYIYDVDNLTLLGRVENDDNGNILRHEGEGAKFIGFFNATDSLNYRLLIHQTSAAANTARTVIDNVQLGPADSFVPATAQNTIETNFLSADVASDGTIADLTFSNLKIGAWYELTAQVYVALDVAVSDTLIQVFANHDGNVIGRSTFQISEAADTSNDNNIMSMDTKFQATATTVTFTANSASSGSTIVGTNDYSGTFAQLETRNDLETNVVSNTQLTQQTIRVAGSGNGGGLWSASGTDIDWTETFDSHGAWNGTQFTAPRSAVYSVKGGIAKLSAPAGFVVYAYVNAVANKTMGLDLGGDGNNLMFSGDIFLNKGDVLSFRTNSIVSANNNSIFHHIEITSKPDFTNYGVVNPEVRIIESKDSSTVAYPAFSSTYTDLTSIDLPEGTWLVSASQTVDPTSATANTWIQTGISTSSGNSFADRADSDNSSFNLISGATGIPSSADVSDYVVTTTTTTTYYLKGRTSKPSGLNLSGYSIKAVKVK